MTKSTTARLVAAIAAACTTTLLFALVVSLSEPPGHDTAPKLAQATATTVTK